MHFAQHMAVNECTSVFAVGQHCGAEARQEAPTLLESRLLLLVLDKILQLRFVLLAEVSETQAGGVHLEVVGWYDRQNAVLE